jgi:NUMOD3 motif
MTEEEWDFLMLECWSPDYLGSYSAVIPGRKITSTLPKTQTQFHTSEWVKPSIGWWKGKPLSPEHKAKISAGNMGREVTHKTRAKIAASLTGKKLTPEHIRKSTAHAKGNKYNLGSKRTDEQKANISRGHVNQRAPQKLIGSAKVLLSSGLGVREVSRRTGLCPATISRVKNGLYIEL